MTVNELTPLQDVLFGILALAAALGAGFAPLFILEKFNK